MYCIACGKQIADDSLFCEHCGAKQAEAAPGPAAGQSPVPSGPGPAAGQPPVPPGPGPVAGQPPVQPAPAPGSGFQTLPAGEPVPIGATPAGPAPIRGAEKKPMSPKTRAALIAAAAVVAVVVGAKLALGALFTPEKTIDKFLTAYQSGDADAFRAVATVAEDRLELTDEVLLPFFNAYRDSERDRFLSSLREALTRDALLLKQGAPANGRGGFRLTEKSYVLFSTYSVEITPLNVQITSEFENTAVEVGGFSCTTGIEGIYTDMLPGVYTVTATCTDPNTGVTLQKTLPDQVISSPVAYMNADSASAAPSYSINIYFDYIYAYMESDTPMTLKEIQVDGKTYAGDLSGMDLYTGFSIGPVNYDSRIKVVTEALGLEFEEEFDLKETGGYCYIVPELPAELEQEAIGIAAAVLPDWLRSVYNYDREALKGLSDSGSLSPYFLDNLDDQVSQMWNGAEDVYYIQFDQIDVQKSRASVYSSIDPVFYANVEIPVIISGVRGYMSLATGEFKESLYPIESSEELFSVSLIYQDGKWMVDGLYWY